MVSKLFEKKQDSIPPHLKPHSFHMFFENVGF
jgi:hypothetical protein